MQRDHLLLTEDLRRIIKGSGYDFEKVLLERRADWFKEANEAASQMVRWAKKGRTASQLSVSRRTFWRLYWGEMALVEEEGVYRQMVAFGKALDQWTRSGKEADTTILEALTKAEQGLIEACHAQLKATERKPEQQSE